MGCGKVIHIGCDLTWTRLLQIAPLLLLPEGIVGGIPRQSSRHSPDHVAETVTSVASRVKVGVNLLGMRDDDSDRAQTHGDSWRLMETRGDS